MKVFLKNHLTTWWLSIGQSDSTEQVVCNGNPLQYSCLEKSMDGGAWRATVDGVTKSRTWLSNFTRLVGWEAEEPSERR